jgi:hypothetical protein
MTETMWRPSGDVPGLTDRARLPRLGKIRLGIKATNARGAEYPRSTDFFVVPDVVKSVYGEKPRELDVVFPSDEVAAVAPVAFKMYSSARGKTCWGDGDRAIRMIDADRIDVRREHTQSEWDAALVAPDSKNITRAEIPCPGHECPFVEKKGCRVVMNLMFLLPKVPGIGVFQLDTGSKNSILDVRGGIELVMQLSGGKLAGIPLKLRIEPMEVISPDDQKKKIVHTLKLISPATLGKVLMAGERNLRELLMADEGSGRSVGLPELAAGREIPPPHEPEEDLYPSQVIEPIRERERLSGAQVRPTESGVVTALPENNDAVGDTPKGTVTVAAARSPLTSTDGSTRAQQLYAELEISTKDQRTWDRFYDGRPEELIAFLEKQLEKRKGAKS